MYRKYNFILFFLINIEKSALLGCGKHEKYVLQIEKLVLIVSAQRVEKTLHISIISFSKTCFTNHFFEVILN